MTERSHRTRLRLRLDGEHGAPYEVTTTVFVPAVALGDQVPVYVSRRNPQRVYVAWAERPDPETGDEYRSGPLPQG